MKTLLTCNLSNNTVLAGDSAWEPPVLTFGETLTLALRFQQTLDGAVVEPRFTVDSVQASLGFVDARPLSRDWALQIGVGPQMTNNRTAPVPYDVSPAGLQAAINAKTTVVAAYGSAKVTKRDGSWFIIFGTGSTSVPLVVRDNNLWPLSMAQIGAVEVDGVWTHEVRLVQLPVDFADTAEAVLPPAPTLKRLQEGGSSGEVEWNEIQRLYVRPDFRATYYLKRGYARTGQLSVDDGAEEIQAALEAILGANFQCTLSANYTIDIEFIEDFAGQSQDLLEIVAVDPPPGDLTFSLPLNRAELLAWLHIQETVTLPLEVKITATENEVQSTYVAVRKELTIRRPLNLPELAESPNIDWLRPPSPKDYVPRSTNTIFVGDKSGAYVIGDGAATVFEVDHPFSTDDVEVWLRENVSDGRQLVAGTDYQARITNNDSVQITALTSAPASGAWIAYVRAAKPISAFAEGLTITTGQVTGLDDLLAAFDTRIGNLETLLPEGVLVRPVVNPEPDEIKIPDRFLIFPAARLPEIFDPKLLDTPTAQTLAALPRSPGLLPAIHDASVTTFTSSALPVSPTAGNVFQNTGTAAVRVPGGLGRRGEFLKPNEYAGYDGRVWYHVTRGSSTSTSFFPSDFEQELISPITFEVDTWRAGQQFVLQFLLGVALFRSNSNAQWVLAVEHGTAPSDTSPATTMLNLQNVVWSDTPILTQRLVVSQLKQVRKFGVRIMRGNDNTMSSEKLIANAWTAAAAPATPAFILRVRLIRFDTENNEVNAAGFAFASVTTVTATVG